MNVSEAPVWKDLGKMSRHEEECFPRISSFKEDGYRKGKKLIFIEPEVLEGIEYLFAQSLDHHLSVTFRHKVWTGFEPGLLRALPLSIHNSTLIGSF